MTLPGAETIKGGIIGDDCFLLEGILFLREPLRLVDSISVATPFTAGWPLGGDMSMEGEVEVSEGVSMVEVVLEAREVWIFFPPKELLPRLFI